MLNRVREPKWANRTVWDIVNSDPRFSQLKSSLSGEARERLRTGERITLFAPTNAALCGGAGSVTTASGT